MKKFLLMFSAAVMIVAGCKKDGGPSTPMNANFDYSPENPASGQEVVLTAVVTGGKTPYTYTWKIGTLADLTGERVSYSFVTYGSYQVTLTVADASGAKVTKRKMVDVIPSEKPEQGTVSVHWGAYIEGYSTISSPAVDDLGNVYAVTRANKMYKFDNDGQQIAVRDIPNAVTEAVTWGTPGIDADGTVYLCSGTYTKGGEASGRFAAYKADLTDKWNFTEFWAQSGKTVKPNMYATNAAIGDDNVYIGYAGDNGTIMSIDKAEGKLVGRLVSGGRGITGGARSGVVLSKTGYIHYYGGKYGLGAGSASALDNAGVGKETAWAWHNSEELPNYTYSSMACLDINGNTCVAGVLTDNEGTKVYAVRSDNGNSVCQYRVEDTYAQEQGGVVATAEGYIVASLKTHRTKETGGIVIVNPVTSQEVARYRTCEDVSGSPAVDKTGNIHFFTEDGDYYIVDKNCNLLVKKNLYTILKNDSALSGKFLGLAGVKFWSSPAIGDDGKVYIQFSDTSERWGGVLCLGYEGCKGPGETDWPMMGHDRRRTNRQN